jgi:hypothetical protein
MYFTEINDFIANYSNIGPKNIVYWEYWDITLGSAL